MKFLKTREQLDKLDKYGTNVIAAKRIDGVAFGLGVAIDGWAVVTDMGLDAVLSSYKGLHDTSEIVAKTFLQIIQKNVGVVIFARQVDEIEKSIFVSERRPVATQYYTTNNGILELLCTIFCTLMWRGEPTSPKRLYSFDIDKVFIVPAKTDASLDSDVVGFLRECDFVADLEVGPPVAKRDLAEVADTKKLNWSSSNHIIEACGFPN